MATETMTPLRLGLVGLGDMGQLYARTLAAAGVEICGCDRPERTEALRAELAPFGVTVLADAAAVAAQSDFVLFSVEASGLEAAVRAIVPALRPGTIVGGQTAIKTLETEVFDRVLPSACDVVTVHSMHGPTLSPVGQTLALIRHRASDEAYARARALFQRLGSQLLELPSAEHHDRMTADIQSVTHLCYESMGTAWRGEGIYPWENGAYLGGIDNVKVLMALRVFAGKSHVYAELAMENPFARAQVQQYARSEAALFALMERGDEAEFRRRVRHAGAHVFGARAEPRLLDDAGLGDYALGAGRSLRKPNSHLSLLAMVDAWSELGIQPYSHLVCQTPPFRLRLGIAEYLFREPELLEESCTAALFDRDIRPDDAAFHAAVQDWARLIVEGDRAGYERKFEAAKAFFAARLPEAVRKGNELIGRLL
jgi:prephenate dehydrogenase (NADP+)